MDALPANRTWQPSCSHGTYQHEAITSRSRQLLMMGTWLPETCWATIRREIKNTKSDSSMDALPANRTWQPSRSHSTCQHKAITSRSRQLLMMGTWLPETCWATIRREIKEYKKWHLVGFSYPHWKRFSCPPDLSRGIREPITEGYAWLAAALAIYPRYDGVQICNSYSFVQRESSNCITIYSFTYRKDWEQGL